MNDAALSADLGRRSARGSLILSLTNVGQLLIAMATTMVMARLLSPAEFGVFAMAMIVYGLIAPIRDFGLPSAIVHHRQQGDSQLNTLFRLNLLGSAMLAIVILALAWPMASFFDEPQLVLIIVTLAALLLIRGSANLQCGLLQRQMAFLSIGVIGLLAQCLGAVVGITLAMSGLGTWALVWQFAATLLAETLLYWWFSAWRPGMGSSVAQQGAPLLRSVFDYGRNLSGSRLVAEGVGQLDRIIIGRADGAAGLGLYQNALRWVSLPLMQILKPMKTVCIASFSRLQEQPDRYRAFVRIAFCMTWTVVLPTFVYLAWQADVIILLLLGDQWFGAIVLFRILALAMLMETVDRLANWICLGEGRMGQRLRWNLLSAPVLVAAMLGGSLYGTVGVAVALATSRVLLAWPVMRYTLRESVLTQTDVWSGVVRPLIATLLSWLSIVLLPRWWSPREASSEVTSGSLFEDVSGLMLHAAGFTVLYGLFWLVQPGGPALLTRCLSTLVDRTRPDADPLTREPSR